jgi:hypothetical protein
MTKKELKEWFWDKFNNCYKVIHIEFPDSIFMFYDINYIRAKKLANILGKELNPPTEINGICLCEISVTYFVIYFDYNEIWSFFEQNYNSDYKEIQKLINSWLKEHDNLKDLTVVGEIDHNQFMLDEQDKLQLI